MRVCESIYLCGWMRMWGRYSTWAGVSKQEKNDMECVFQCFMCLSDSISLSALVLAAETGLRRDNGSLSSGLLPLGSLHLSYNTPLWLPSQLRGESLNILPGDIDFVLSCSMYKSRKHTYNLLTYFPVQFNSVSVFPEIYTFKSLRISLVF